MSSRTSSGSTSTAPKEPLGGARPYCLAHFYDVAFEASSSMHQSTSQENAPTHGGKTGPADTSRCPPGRRIQPPRAVKSPPPIRDNCDSKKDGHEKGDTTSVNGDHQEDSPMWDFLAELTRQLTRATPLPDCTGGCAFGPRPIICVRCADEAVREGVIRSKQKQQQPSPDAKLARRRAPYAKMVPCCEDWQELELLETGCVTVAGVRFVVDTCDDPVVFVFGQNDSV
ncbi:hypothetical protein O9K51_07712 [Purpureocillium lavendulum]|uniref:Uncharacterized protein n=1 Tax=Purpureocillium lavendulum TaxID=1247861 RepID=A0AB34FME4_9HYPO|nr:hypothetical protein O9K51_07712 [Purpureocillium lavendulum]